MPPIAQEAAAAMRSLPARCAALAELAGWVGEWSQQQRLPLPLALRLRLVAEELFLNAVTHGYGGDCDARVELSLRALADGVELQVEDRARPFDPFATAGAPSASPDPHARPVGKLGLPLVCELARVRDYRRIEERNRVRVELPLRP